jgi:hypothetical protein
MHLTNRKSRDILVPDKLMRGEYDSGYNHQAPSTARYASFQTSQEVSKRIGVADKKSNAQSGHSHMNNNSNDIVIYEHFSAYGLAESGKVVRRLQQLSESELAQFFATMMCRSADFWSGRSSDIKGSDSLRHLIPWPRRDRFRPRRSAAPTGRFDMPEPSILAITLIAKQRAMRLCAIAVVNSDADGCPGRPVDA